MNPDGGTAISQEMFAKKCLDLVGASNYFEFAGASFAVLTKVRGLH